VIQPHVVEQQPILREALATPVPRPPPKRNAFSLRTVATAIASMAPRPAPEPSP
jgi:hypothetical protein